MKKKLNPAWLYLIVAIALIPCCVISETTLRLYEALLHFNIGLYSKMNIFINNYTCINIPNLIYLCTILYLIITLFRKKYDLNLLFATASVSFVQILFLLISFNWYTISTLIINILFCIIITFFAVVRIRFSKYLPKFLRIFPSFLKLLIFFGNYWYLLNVFDYQFYCIAMAVEIIDIIATALFSYYLVAPPKKKKTIHTRINTSVEYNAYCGMAKHILLSIFTLGIWQCIWVWRTTKFLNQTPKAEQYNPTKKLLLCMFVPFYMIYWLYKHGQRIDAMYKDKNLGNSDMATLCLILGIFIPIVAYIIMQDKINTLCTVETNEVNEDINENKEINFEDLNKLKDLLDNGIITQEEFEQKKKQLLGL